MKNGVDSSWTYGTRSVLELVAQRCVDANERPLTSLCVVQPSAPGGQARRSQRVLHRADRLGLLGAAATQLVQQGPLWAG